MESDPRFPSGPWTGFFLDRRLPGRHAMQLHLTFDAGRMTGNGRDWVGPFTIDGTYRTSDGACAFVKQYVGKHAVHYRGFNEGRGIWGTWELRWLGFTWTGGFHIWPEGMPDPTRPHLEAEIDEPIEVEAPQRVPAPVGV
jgi:hypothetical protein